jgi:hypothetical protein
VSLIDEALKRAQAAADRDGPRSRPWVPTPMPDAGLARRRRVVRAGLVGLAAVAALLIWAASPRARRAEAAPPVDGRVPVPTEVRRGGNEPPSSPAMAAVAAPTPRNAVVAPTPRNAVVAPTPRSGVAAAGPRGGAAPGQTGPAEAQRSMPLVASIETTPVHVPPPPHAADAMASASGSPHVRAHATPAPAGKSYKGKVELPDGGSLELGGIVWSDTEPRALINDRVVGVGAYVQGYTLERIEEDRVVLEKDGKRITVTVK